MKNTRLMEILFSNTDEEIAKQVDNDIRSAESGNPVDSDELAYEKTDDGVAITDKETGEVTLAQRSDEADTYDLIAVPDEQLEKYLHPSANGFTPGMQVGAREERVKDHMTPELLENMGLNPNAGYEGTVEENAEEKEFSIYSDNEAFQKIFSYPQEFMDQMFSEVIESTETANVGDLKIEKCGDDDNSVVVTAKTTGDQAKVTLDGDEMEVQELDSKNFSDSYLPLFIIGVQPYDHLLVEAQAYTEEAADELVQRLTEDGVEACQVFEDPEAARDYAFGLLENLGANPAAGEVDEPELQHEFSDCAIYAADYRTNDSVFMSRMFSEENLDITDTRDAVEQALSEGNTIELENGAKVTPIEATKAIISDNGEFTLAEIQGEDVVVEHISRDYAADILGDGLINALADCDDDDCDYDDDEERDFSDVYCDEGETRFFSECETLTSYMERIFSEESDQNIVEEALECGQEIENDTEIVTPVSDDVAVVEDKENGEYSKVVMLDDDRMNIHPISEDEAESLLDDVLVSEDEEVEREFSDIYCDEYGTRFFSALEPMTSYMERVFSEESDQDLIEQALEDGKQIENDNEIITPVSETVAVIEDKETGEFTKAEISDDDEDDEDSDDMELTPISEDEADDLLEDVEVDDENEEVEHEFSDVYCDRDETRFFSALEPMTDYMERIFTEESDQDIVEDALDSQEQIENDTEIVTPVSDDVAVIKDKKTGDYTKAEVTEDEEDLEMTPISKEEADELMEDVEVSEEKQYSSTLDKFFAEAVLPSQQPAVPVQGQPATQAPVQGGEVVEDQAQVPTVENVEDKALLAVQSIKAAAEEAAATIMEAKAAPAPVVDPEIQEAQFSERTFCQGEDTLISWLHNK